ncbi:MAG: AAA family ATPase, partial [Kiritimatiellia bacterium]
MNAIKSVEIRNFQSHEHTIVEFAGAGLLTVITGASDCGKTAIIRAIKWALFNEPRGMDFMRAGAEFAQVTVLFTSGVTVIRERRKSVNRYTLLLPDSDRQVFEAFGDGVPVEIRMATGIAPIHISDLELQLQLAEQLDGPFLGSKSTTGPARAKIVGKLAGTEVVDHAGKEVARDMHRANMEAPNLASQIASLETQIARYDWLPTTEQTLEQAITHQQSAQTAQARRDLLNRIAADISQAAIIRRENERILSRVGMIPEAVTRLADMAEQKLLTRRDLLNIAESLKRTRDAIQATQDTLRRTSGTEEAMQELIQATQVAIRRRALAAIQARRNSIQATRTQTEQAITALAGVLQALDAAEQAGQHLTRLD